MWIVKSCGTGIRRLMQVATIRWQHLFVLPVCNLRADRAPVVCGICFPLCWRCTAIILGMMVVRTGGLAELAASPLATGVLLVTPCGIDGALQYGWGVESTNLRRIVFGLLAGCGLALIRASNCIA